MTKWLKLYAIYTFSINDVLQSFAHSKFGIESCMQQRRQNAKRSMVPPKKHCAIWTVKGSNVEEFLKFCFHL